MPKLYYSKHAVKDIKALDPVVKERVRQGLEALAKNQLQGKALTGDLKGLWSLRVGKCRIIFRPDRDEINVISVRFRRESYR